MKLLYYELKKLAGSRLHWALLAICLLVNGVLCYTFAEKNEAYPYLKKVEADYVRDPDALYDYYERLIEQSDKHQRLMEAYYRGELTEAPVFDPPASTRVTRRWTIGH